jgi:single-strand DNA-binding protein
MLSGKGEGGGRQGAGAGRPDNQSQGSAYEEPTFNPDDDIPF